MESTNEFVKKIHDKQQKDEKNREKRKTSPSKKLPNNGQH